jgi:hypothetical protein
MEIYKMILMAEEKMAREVTLGVIVTRPLKVWHNIIPDHRFSAPGQCPA